MTRANQASETKGLSVYDDQASISPVQAVAAAALLLGGVVVGSYATKEFFEDELTHAEDVHNQKLAAKDARIQEILSYGDSCKRAQNLTERGYALKNFPQMVCEDGKPNVLLVYGSRDGANVAKNAVEIARVLGNSSKAKADVEVTDADKAQYHMIGLGGPCVNNMVAQTAAAGELKLNGKDLTCNNWPGQNFGLIAATKDLFAPGKTFVTVAGTRVFDTDAAAEVLADYDKYLFDVDSQMVKVTRSSGTGELIVDPVTGVEYKVEFLSAVDLSNAAEGRSAAPAWKISGGNGIQIGNKTVDTIYLSKYTGRAETALQLIDVFYPDESNKIQKFKTVETLHPNIGLIKTQSGDLPIDLQKMKDSRGYSLPVNLRIGPVQLNTSIVSGTGEFSGLGTVNLAEPEDVIYLAGVGHEIGTLEKDHNVGINTVIKSPKINSGRDRVVLEIETN